MGCNSSVFTSFTVLAQPALTETPLHVPADMQGSPGPANVMSRCIGWTQRRGSNKGQGSKRGSKKAKTVQHTGGEIAKVQSQTL